MTTTMQSGSTKGIPQVNSETKIKEKKSLGKRIINWFKKPFKKASTSTDIPSDTRTDAGSSQNLDKSKKKDKFAHLGFNPYQHPAHGQIFVPGSIPVIRNGNQTGFVEGNIAVAYNAPGLNMNSVPMLLASNTVQECDPVKEETPKLEGEMSPKYEEMPQINPVDIAGQLKDIEHMNEKDAEAYKYMRESRMLYASNTQQNTMMMNDPKYYVAQMNKSMAKVGEYGRDIREARQY